MEISEIFYSIQGEGLLSGYPTVFVRVSGCNLRCSYCDTKYSYEEPGKIMSIDSVVREVRRYRTRYVCITGGEPLLQTETLDLIENLLKFDYKNISVETNGSIDIKPLVYRFGRYGDRVTLSMDIKCPSSGMHKKMRLENIHHLRSYDQLKFVVDGEEDYMYAKEIIEKYKPKTNIVFQPVWGSDVRKLVKMVLEDHMDARVSLQIHKIIWDNRRGI